MYGQSRMLLRSYLRCERLRGKLRNVFVRFELLHLLFLTLLLTLFVIKLGHHHHLPLDPYARGKVVG